MSRQGIEEMTIYSTTKKHNKRYVEIRETRSMRTGSVTYIFNIMKNGKVADVSYQPEFTNRDVAIQMANIWRAGHYVAVA